MQMIDASFKNVFKVKKYFVDFINAVAFQGEQVVKEDGVEELDPETLQIIGTRSEGPKVRKRIRDALRKCLAWCDEKQVYFICGIEGQSEVDYGMPFRILEYETMQYAQQLANLKSKHSTRSFRREDRFLPIVTFVLNLSGSRWTGYRSLWEMMTIPEHLKKYVRNFEINLCDPFDTEDSTCDYLRSGMKFFFDMCKKAHSSVKLLEYMRESSQLGRMDDMVWQLTEATLNLPVCNLEDVKDPQERKKKMCKAVEEIHAMGVAEGRAEGEAKGRAEGEAKGRAEGEAKGRAEGEAKGRAEGEAKGRAEGREDTLRGYVNLEHSRNLPLAEIIRNLQDFFQMQKEEAEKFVHTVLA